MPDPNEPIMDLEPVAFGPIFFEFNQHLLRGPWHTAALAEYLKKTGKLVLLSGHASDEGTDDYNMALGARRAQAVRDALEAAGVPRERISWISYGEGAPLDPNDKPKNRRVEIAILEELK